MINPRKTQVIEQIENNCELQIYGYELDDEEVHDKFKIFWNWLKE